MSATAIAANIREQLKAESASSQADKLAAAMKITSGQVTDPNEARELLESAGLPLEEFEQLAALLEPRLQASADLQRLPEMELQLSDIEADHTSERLEVEELDREHCEAVTPKREKMKQLKAERDKLLATITSIRNKARRTLNATSSAAHKARGTELAGQLGNAERLISQNRQLAKAQRRDAAKLDPETLERRLAEYRQVSPGAGGPDFSGEERAIESQLARYRAMIQEAERLEGMAADGERTAAEIRQQQIEWVQAVNDPANIDLPTMG